MYSTKARDRKIPEYAAVDIAAIHAYRGEADEAFGWLDKAIATSDPGLAETVGDPLFENLYDDPRWRLFLERIGRSPAQLAAIEFEITLPTRSGDSLLISPAPPRSDREK